MRWCSSSRSGVLCRLTARPDQGLDAGRCDGGGIPGLRNKTRRCLHTRRVRSRQGMDSRSAPRELFIAAFGEEDPTGWDSGTIPKSSKGVGSVARVQGHARPRSRELSAPRRSLLAERPQEGEGRRRASSAAPGLRIRDGGRGAYSTRSRSALAQHNVPEPQSPTPNPGRQA